MRRHGWFAIPGMQTGERALSEQTAGLDFVREAAPGSTVLDVGCAEGLVGQWLLQCGARLTQGFDKHRPYIDTARRISNGRAAFYSVMDAEQFADRAKLADALMLRSFDIVLVLNLLQKLSRPDLVLANLAGVCGNILALSLPAPVIKDARSGWVEIDPRALLPGFDLIDERPAVQDAKRGSLGHRLIFKRVDRWA